LVRRILNSLHDSETRFRGTFEQAAVGLSHVSLQGVLLQVNDRYCAITGQAREQLVGRSFQQILGAQDAEDAWLHCGRLLLGEKQDYVTNRLLANSGTARWARTSYTLVRDEAGTPAYFLHVLEDISGEHRLTEQLSYQASHDALTGLVNRFEFENRVGVALGKVTTGGPVGALCYMDLDQFKIINDTLGHMAGDELLHQLSLELKNRLRVGDTLARLGGDEFGVLLEGCPIGAASSIAETMRRTVDEKRFLWKGREYRVGVSIGVVAIDTHTSSVQQLLSDADEACYLAKDKGRNMVHIHEPDSAQLQHRHDEMQWVTRLREALAGDGLFLMYQSILPLQTEQADGEHFEVLLRLREDSGEIVPPGSFLSAAERYNLGSRVDEWVVREMLGWLSDHKSGLPHVELCSINLSAQSLGDARFLEFLQAEIYQSGFPAHKLCFELTETAAVADLATAGRFINTIREAGCRFSLDDFGSGMSSFAYLHALPVDFLKIDGAFIRGIASDRVSRAVVSSINDISHTLGKYTIAEFIETELILQTAREIGLDYAQGYAIAKPRDLADLLKVTSLASATAVGPVYIPDNALPR
jgi:diguanylate cyclase (GGDEF)-like protein/PAS domain S-box-containing protein